MPFDEQNEGNGGGGHGGDHDGIAVWAGAMGGFIEQQTEKEKLCGFCATTVLANMLLANNMSYLLNEPDEMASFLRKFTQKAADAASKIKAERDAED